MARTAYQRELYFKRRQAGLCIRCGGPAEDFEAKKRSDYPKSAFCKEHREANRAAQAKLQATRRPYNRTKQLRDERRKAGLCVYCGAPAISPSRKFAINRKSRYCEKHMLEAKNARCKARKKLEGK